jgi:hypothetical protein
LSPVDAGAALQLCDPLIRGQLTRAQTIAIDPDEAYSRVQIKIWKALKTFKRKRGSRVFSYLNAVAHNTMRTLCSEQRKDNGTQVTLEEAPEPFECVSPEEMEEIIHCLRQVKTICTRENEIHAQRWLVESFIRTEFSIPRHEAVRALQIAFAVDLKLGRLIFDRTVLELRRTLLNGRVRFPSVNIAELRDKREKGLLKYKPYLSHPHFSKLVFLLRGLAPAIVQNLIEQDLRKLNGNREPEARRAIVRRHLWSVLNGFPDAKPLFEDP